jgi:hypothetical protein
MMRMTRRGPHRTKEGFALHTFRETARLSLRGWKRTTFEGA